MSAPAVETPSLEREWWLRLLLVVQSPRTTFAALRDDSDDTAGARAEPVLLTVALAGIAGLLSTNFVGQILDDADNDHLVVAAAVLVGGVIQGALLYFVLGAFLSIGLEFAGSGGSYRRDRHVLAFASVPLALSLLMWPVRLTLYGDDVFSAGGTDRGAGASAFEAIELVALGWTAFLVVVGVRTVESWSWPRALLASVPLFVLPALALARAHGLF